MFSMVLGLVNMVSMSILAWVKHPNASLLTLKVVALLGNVKPSTIRGTNLAGAT